MIVRRGPLRPTSLAFLLAALLWPAASCPQAPNSAQLSERKIIKLRPLPLDAVRLTGGPLKHAQELDAKYLLELEPDRMLAYLRIRAGLQPKAKGYGGWDGGGRQLTGHIAGHYLSAVSLMWAATGDARFKERADYIVDELKQIQDAQGDGYIGALLDKDGVDGKVHFQELCRGVDQFRRIRSERAVVAMVRRAQDIRGASRCLSLHRKPCRTRCGDKIRRLGRHASFRRWMTTRFSAC